MSVTQSAASDSAVLRYHDIKLDTVKRVASRQGQPIRLTKKEFNLLAFFMNNAGKVLTRTVIGQNVWDANFDPFSNVIDVYVSMLRRKVDKPFDKPLIHTVVGSGYLFGSPEKLNPPAAPTA